MPHSIRVGLIGMTDLGEKMFRGIMDRNLIARNCMFVADTNPEKLEVCSEYGIHGYTELTAPMTRAEVIFLNSVRRDFSSMLSAICGTTRSKVLAVIVNTFWIVLPRQRRSFVQSSLRRTGRQRFM